MWGYSLPSVIHWKSILPYIFASKGRATTWAIGALVVSLTVTALSMQPHKPTDGSYEKKVLPNPTKSSANIFISPPPVAATENIVPPSAQPHQEQSTTNIRINNQSISVPADSSIHKIIQSDDGKTKLDVSIDASSTNTQSNSSSTVQLNVTSKQEAVIENSE
jgi:hypothetical protein